MTGLRLGMLEDGGGEHTTGADAPMIGARERKLLAALALFTYEEASGRPPSNDDRSPAERERSLRNAQWWWLDDPGTGVRTARYFVETILEQDFDTRRSLLEAEWLATGVLRSAHERRAQTWRPLPWAARALDMLVLAVAQAAIAAGGAPIRDRLCPGVPGTTREVCGAPARRRRCVDCARVARQRYAAGYYHRVGAGRREERNRQAG